MKYKEHVVLNLSRMDEENARKMLYRIRGIIDSDDYLTDLDKLLDIVDLVIKLEEGD